MGRGCGPARLVEQTQPRKQSQKTTESTVMQSPLIESSSPAGGISIRHLFAYPFRIFFLSLSVWAIVLVPLWLVVLLAPFQPPLALPPLHWHQYEMLFGLLNAAIAGFLLTAVCTWTQTHGLHGGRLLALWLVWLAGRLVMLTGDALPPGWAALPDLLFLPLVMLDAGTRIWRARQMRQLPVLAVLTLIWLMQLGFHLAPALGWYPGTFTNAALLVAMVLMLVIGGRITPAFSGNWLRAQGRAHLGSRSWPWLDRASTGSVLALVALMLLSGIPAVPSDMAAALNGPPLAALATAAALLCAARLWGWRGWRVAAEPLLWILHLSLWWIPIALLLLAGSALAWWPATVWQHAVGTGAMSGLILGVISRVALGHTGRTLSLPGGMVLAFVAIHIAALARIATAMGALPWRAGLEFSAACWVLAFALFVWRYAAMLSSPRPDGRPG